MVIGGINRRIHDTCKTCNCCGDTEHQRKSAVDINSEQANGFPICHAGTDYHAECGELQKTKDSGNNDGRKPKIDQSPIRIDNHVGIKAQQHPEIKRSGKHVGGRGRDRVGTIEIFNNFLQHDGQTKGDKDLICMGALVEVFDQPAFHDKADHQHHGNRKQNC